MKRSPKLRSMRTMLVVLLGTLAVGACSDDDGPTNPGPEESSFVRAIDDINYVRGKYFFLQYPADQLATNSRIDLSTVRVFVDDHNGGNNQGVREGLAAVDPTRSPAGVDTLSGFFEGLLELTDFQVTLSYFGERFPVLVLSDPIPGSQVLAVAYDEILPGGSVRHVGSIPEDPGERMQLKLLQVSGDFLPESAIDPGYFETDPALSPFAVTRDLAIKSFYDLQERNLDPRSLEITICRGNPGADTVSAYSEGAQRFPYLRILGIDLFTDDGTGAPLLGPEGRVDQFTSAWFLDAETGILHFPDLRPFDPRISPRPDARPEEDEFFRSRLSPNTDVPGLRGRVLWPPGATGVPGVAGVTPAGLEANRAVYDKRLIASGDRKYYIRVVLPHREALADRPAP